MTTQTATAQIIITETATAQSPSPAYSADAFLDKVRSCLAAQPWANSAETVPVTFNRSAYSAVLVSVVNDGNDIGMLEVSAVTRQVRNRNVYCVRMRLMEGWILPRANDDWFFTPKAMKPEHAGSYAECFMNLGGLTPLAQMYEMMKRTRFFDNARRGNRHTTVAHSLNNHAIVVKLKLFELGVCDFTVRMNRNGETVMLLKDASGETLTQYINKFMPWDVRTHLNNVFCDY